MPEVVSLFAREWGLQAIAHMNMTGHHNLVWHSANDYVDGARIGCPECNTWFTITVSTLRADPDPRARILEDFLRTTWGRDRILEVLTATAAANRENPDRDVTEDYPFDPPEPERPRRTAWDRVLEDD